MVKHILIFVCWATITIAQQNGNYMGLYPIKSADKWGFIDSTGTIKIQPVFDAVDKFDASGNCVVELNNSLGIINMKGEIIIGCQYDQISNLGNDLILTKKNGLWSLKNISDKLLVNNIGGKITLMKNGYFTYEMVSGIGLGHIEKGRLTEPVYKNVSPTQSKKYFTFRDTSDNIGLIDSTGKLVILPRFDSIIGYEHFFIVKKGIYWGAFDTNGDSISNQKYNFACYFNDSIISLCKNGSCNLWSLQYNKFILENYKTAENRDDYIFFTSASNQNGLIEKNGQVVVSGNFNNIEKFFGNLFKVCDNGLNRWGIYNSTKKELMHQPVYNKINTLNNLNIALLTKEDKYGIINHNGEIIIDVKYSSINSLGNLIKAKSNNTLELFYIGENGDISGSEIIENYKSISVNAPFDPFAQNTTQNTNNPNNINNVSSAVWVKKINDSLSWEIGRTGKYGIFNNNSGKFVLAPSFSSYIVYPSLELSVAEIKFSKDKVVFSAGNNYSIDSKFLLISNKTGKPISKPEFLHIEFNDFLIDSLPLARCITEGTKFGLINREGKIVMRGLAYIDKFVEGKARCTNVGNIVFGDNESESLTSSANFFDSLLFNRSRNYYGIKTKFIKCQGGEWGFVDTLANWVIKPITHKLQFVNHFSGDRSIVLKNKKWGLIDNNGQIILPFIYDEISFVPNSNDTLYLLTQKTRRKGCIDQDGKVVVPASYDKTGQFCEGIVTVYKEGKWGFVNENGQEIIDCQYRNVHHFSEGLAAVSIKGRWGFIDNTGNIVIKPVYTKVGDFKEGLAWVRQTNGKIAYIYNNGETKFENDFQIANDMENGIARVKISKGWCIIDNNGNIISKPNPDISYIEPFNQYGLAKVKVGNSYRLMDRTGKLIKNCKYTHIDNFNEGYAVVRKHGFHNFILFRNTKFGFIDSTGKMTCRPRFNNLGQISCGLATFMNNKGKYGYINPFGNIVVKAEFIKVTPLIAGRAIVYRKHNCSGIIDNKGNYIVAPNLDKIVNISENIALVKTAYNEYHFMHEDLQRHSPINFEAAHNFYKRIAPVRTSNRWGAVNDKGLQLVTPKYGGMDKFKNGFANIEVNKYQGIVNKKGEVVVPTNFDYMDYVGANILRIEKDNKVGYMNSNGNWIWKMND